MFNKTADPTSAPTRSASNTKSVFAADLKITGEVSSAGDIEMAGDVDGNISARSLSITGEGRMRGTIRAETVEVKGKMDGQIEAGSFSMRATAQVAADVTYSTLVIDSGAQIDGRFAKKK